MRFNFYLTICFILTVCFSGLSANALQFQIQALEDLGGGFSRAYGINDDGKIVGQSYNQQGKLRGFYWDNGAATDLGTLGGDKSHAQTIGPAGHIGGWAGNINNTSLPAYWNENGVNALPTLGGASGTVWSAGVNAFAGLSYVNSSVYHATLWKNGVAYDLGTLGGKYSVAYSMFNDGQFVAGEADNANGKPNAVLWNNLSPISLGLLNGGTWSSARGVNRWMQVAVNGNTYGSNARAALWSYNNGNPTFTNIGTLGGNDTWAYGINDWGWIVGESTLSNGFVRGYVWDGAAMHELGTLGGYFSKAYGINNRGEIVGFANDASGRTCAVKWTVVPEPSSVLIICSAGILFVFRKMRK